MREKGGDQPYDPVREFNGLYDRYGKAIYGYLAMFVKNNTIAEDLTQEVFMRAYEQIEKNQGKREISKTWLYAVAKNLALDYQKKNTTTRETIIDPGLLHNVEDLTVNFARRLEMEEIREKVMRFLDTLSPKEKTVFILRTQDNLRYREIGNVLALSERNAKRIMRSALRKLVFMLNESGVRPGQEEGPS